MMNKRLISFLLVYSILANLFVSTVPGQTVTPEPEKGLVFSLREAPGTPTAAAPEAPDVQSLAEGDALAIFERLPPLESPGSDTKQSVVPTESLPPPKAGRVIPMDSAPVEAVPPTETVRTEKLGVLRTAPNGTVPFAAELSVTFSRPMIAVGSQEVASQVVPVRLSPEIAGRWRWLGTRTIVFVPETRFPMATRYTATVPAGTVSAAGEPLEKEVSWTFSTAPPEITDFQPTGARVRPGALVYARFNQRIEPASVLAKTTATADGRKIGLRLATSDEIAADKNLSERIANQLPDRFVVFRAVEPFPRDSLVTVTFDAETPSAEGPLTASSPFSRSFETYGSFKLAKSFCGWPEDNRICGPNQDFSMRFTNQLDPDSFDKSLVRIEPPIEDAEIVIYGDRIDVERGIKRPRQNYRVTVSGRLKDSFGQTLGSDITAEFRTGPETPAIFADSGRQGFLTVDPDAKPVYSVFARNYKRLKIKIYAVGPEDFGAYQSLRETESTKAPEIGTPVFEKRLGVRGKADEFKEARIDLAPGFAAGNHHLILVVEPESDPEDTAEQRVVVWVQSTKIGVDGFVDPARLTLYASDLKSGKPLADVEIALSTGQTAKSAENGLATIALPSVNATGDWLIAKRGGDSAVLFATDSYFNNRQWRNTDSRNQLRWFVFDDRAMYRPGETVSLKGYLRRFTAGVAPDIDGLNESVTNVDYALRDPLGNEIAKGRADVNKFGAFDLRIDLPENVNLGYQTLKFSAENEIESSVFEHRFQIQEFRRPEFEVTAKNDSPAPYLLDQSAIASVEAKYYAGGALKNADTVWTVKATPAEFSPPNREGFTFGEFVPWWQRWRSNRFETTKTKTFSGKTDANGKHRLALDFLSADEARPYTVTAEARVSDVNRQTLAASTTMLVHPSDLYVGVRTETAFVLPNQSFKVETIVTDIGGEAVAGVPLTLVAELKDWEQIKGEWKDVTVSTEVCETRSRESAAVCDFNASRGGRFEFTATVYDSKRRKNVTKSQMWVGGGKSEISRDVSQETVELIPAKKLYAPGDTAEILLNAPFYPAEGVITIRRRGIVRTERFTLNEASTVLKVPIDEGLVSNFHLQVDLFGSAARVYFEDERDKKLPTRPAFATGELSLGVSTKTRTLTVTAEPRSRGLAPGGETEIDVAVKDSQGRPAGNTEVAVVAVDESILALTDYRIPDPIGEFYGDVEQRVSSHYSRGSISLADPWDLTDASKLGFRSDGRGAGVGNGYGFGSGNGSGDGDGDGISFGLYDLRNGRESDSPFRRLEILANLQRPPNAPEPIRIRRNFDALALFSPTVRTDRDGRATVPIKLPDNLTRYRITAVAVTNAKQFGKTESAITASQRLMVRPSAPRFMNYGDRAELPVVLQNQTNETLTVNVAVRASNARLTNGIGRRVAVSANDRVELRFPVTTDSTGLARFQVGAVAGELADAAEFAFPVLTPATTEAFATYGTSDKNGALSQKVSAPPDVWPDYGGLEITTSTTQLQELTDAFIYLHAYPFECSEQVSSRMLSTAALRDVLAAFKADGLPPKGELDARMNVDIEKIRKLQHADGGFNFWSATGDSIPYVSVHVTHALARAREKGFAVPPKMLDRAGDFLKNIEARSRQYYGNPIGWTLSAYALYVRDLLGDRDLKKARRLVAESKIETLSPETIAWLLPILAEDRESAKTVREMRRVLLNRVVETAGRANFVSGNRDGEYELLSSNRRTDGIVLEALIRTRSATTDDLLPKLVRGLLDGRVRGRWRNTQENAFALLALDRYFKEFEKDVPDLKARIWFGGSFVGERSFAGRSADSGLVKVPMSEVLRQGTPELILDRQGTGRLYYRIGLRYAPKNARLESADYGFTVERGYSPIDDPADVIRNADRSWTIRAGARVRVRLRLVAPKPGNHVALVDHLPAGFEIVNPELLTSERLPPEPENPRGRWFDHQNLRDDRAEVFRSMLWPGIWDYTYIVRATTPGEFIVPPAKAEEMYSPETFGRTATEFVTVK
ncbi:MAG: Ig-like domain-containing protein [Acidobacteria bacterium]|nr:Ig-like domain-containing protein [Acidobacteriota bacterium]